MSAELFTHKRNISSPSAPCTPSKKSRPSKIITNSPSFVLIHRSPLTPPDETCPTSHLDKYYQDLTGVKVTRYFEVKRATLSKNGKEYAIKVTRSPCSGPLEKKNKQKEVNCLKKVIGKPNCLQLLESWEQGHHLYISTAYCKLGSLEQLSDACEVSLDEKEILVILQDILIGVSNIHESGLIHRDIKPENIFIEEDGTMVVGDFGVTIDDEDIDNLQDIGGDGRFLCPHALNGKLSKSSDIFSIGMLGFALCSNIKLDSRDEGHSFLIGDSPNKASTLPFRGNISSKLKETIAAMLSYDIKKRPTAVDLLNDPLFSSLTKDDIAKSRKRIVELLNHPTPVLLDFSIDSD